MTLTRTDSAVGVFWDYENCSPAQTVNAIGLVTSIRKITDKHGPIKQFRVYKDADYNPNAVALRVDLQASGVSIIDCPHNNMKDVVDKVLIVDVMAFAREYPNATIVLIAGDRDYAYLLSILRSYLHHVIVITPGPRFLAVQASEIIEWKSLLPRHQPQGYTIPSLMNTVPQHAFHLPTYPTTYAAVQRPPAPVLSCPAAQPPPPAPPPILPPSTTTVRSSEEEFLSCLSSVDQTGQSMDEPSPCETPLQRAARIPLPDTPQSSITTVHAEEIPIRYLPNDISPPGDRSQEEIKEGIDWTPPPAKLIPSVAAFTPDPVKAKETFRPLIRVLVDLEDDGATHPLRGTVATAILRSYPDAYRRCNVATWAEYSRMAEAAGVITLGSEPDFQGRDWVALNPAFKKARTRPSRELASTRTSSVPEAFAPLLNFLDVCTKEGKTKVIRSLACDFVLRTQPGLFRRFGYENWKQYAAAAEKAGLVRLTGGQIGGGDTFISLEPKLRLKH